MNASDKQAQLLALIVPALLLGGAYISQYVFGLYPCEMCWWQRWPHFAALAFVALSFAVPPKRIWPKRVLIAIAAGGILTSGLIGFFHAGVEYGWWEGLTTCSMPAATGGDLLDAIFAQPIIRCDDVQWSLLGISLAGFNALFSTAAALTIWKQLAKTDKTGGTS